MVNLNRGAFSMALTLKRFQPGDIISSDYFNQNFDQILASLTSLGDRLSALEGAGPGGNAVVISGLSPTGPIAMGSILQVTGRNFGLVGTSVVTIDNVAVQPSVGSGDTMLIVTIPLLQGVPLGGRNVILTVSNPRGFASTSFVVLPAQATVPTGSLQVTLVSPPATPQLVAGQSYLFGYSVKAISTLQDDYTLSPSVDAGWPAVVVDINNVPLQPAEIRIPKSDPPNGTTHPVRVRVSIPAGTPANATARISLSVAAKSNPLNMAGASTGDSIVVGGAPPPAQQIPIRFTQVLAPAGAGPAVVDQMAGLITIPTAGSAYAVDFIAEINDPNFIQGTNYDVTLTNPANNWTARIMGGATALTAVLTPNSTTSSNLIRILLTANAGAAPAALDLRVQKQGNASFFGTRSMRIQT